MTSTRGWELRREPADATRTQVVFVTFDPVIQVETAIDDWGPDQQENDPPVLMIGDHVTYSDGSIYRVIARSVTREMVFPVDNCGCGNYEACADPVLHNQKCGVYLWTLRVVRM